MVRRVSGMALLRYVFRSVSIWKGRVKRCLAPHGQGGRLARVTKNGTDASVLVADSDCQSQRAPSDCLVQSKDEKRGQVQGKLQLSGGARATDQPGGQLQGPKRQDDFPTASGAGDRAEPARRHSGSRIGPSLHDTLSPLPSHADTRLLDMTYRLDGFQQPDAELLDAAVCVGKLHKSLACSRLGLPHPNHGEHVPKGCVTSLP